MIKLVLASQSPRRRELIQLLGYPVECIAADADESSVTQPDPAINVAQTARLKAAAIAAQLGGMRDEEYLLIVAADTTVALDGQMLGKPVDEADAERMLRALRGRTHHVHTGLVVIEVATHRVVSGAHTAVVTMRPYSDEEITAYIASGDPMDKAGAYGIQHLEFQPVAHLDGCYTGVMGLSVCDLLLVLHQLGLPMRADLTAVHDAHQAYACPVYASVVAALR
jgi:septum formation protein